jgi:plasmid stabilization system protein ParE
VLPFRFTRRAHGEITRAQAWWLANRDKAPAALEDDLAEAYASIAAAPRASPLWAASRKPEVRRYLLRRVRYHLYYRVEARHIVILALWHSSRRPPSQL